MSQNNEVRQALAFVENAVDALSDVSLQAAATTLAAEVRRLRAVNQTVNAIWEDVDAYARNHSEIQLGGSVSQHALKLMKERDALAAELAKLRQQEPAVIITGEYSKEYSMALLPRKEFPIGTKLYTAPVPAVAVPAIDIETILDASTATMCQCLRSRLLASEVRRLRALLQSAPQPAVAAPAVQKDCVSQDESTMMMAASALVLYRAGESAEYMAKAIEALLQSSEGCCSQDQNEVRHD